MGVLDFVGLFKLKLYIEFYKLLLLVIILIIIFLYDEIRLTKSTIYLLKDLKERNYPYF
jgi:hypothetical protein